MADSGQGQTHHLGREAIHTCWNRDLPPRLTIAPGDTVVFGTLEPSWGGLARDIAGGGGAAVEGDPTLIALVAKGAHPEAPKGIGTELGGHALTGPIAIAGAEPGDTLVVEIVDVVPGDWGWTHVGPDSGGLLRDAFTDDVVHLWDLRERGRARFAPGITIPIAPFCGVMGVAPAESGPHRTFPPRSVGGNLDIRQLTAGSTLFLPIAVPGALFSVGDAHAAQGDGEVAGTAIETDATVTLHFDLRKGEMLPSPQFITPSIGPATGPWFAATGSHADLYEAAREALRGVLDYLHQHHGLESPQACILASVCVDLKVSQIVNAGVYTVSAFLPLSIFRGGRGKGG
jgi:acetamidase/formamidase